MFLYFTSSPTIGESFPRVRGDVPIVRGLPDDTTQFSPRARGCSAPHPTAAELYSVFPACAGMFRTGLVVNPSCMGFPRVRGDVPNIRLARALVVRFSPRARGCSLCCGLSMVWPWVFPACAGMFRFPVDLTEISFGFPRVRGDVPNPTES